MPTTLGADVCRGGRDFANEARRIARGGASKSPRRLAGQHYIRIVALVETSYSTNTLHCSTCSVGVTMTAVMLPHVPAGRRIVAEKAAA
jgi:hypothetical protein